MGREERPQGEVGDDYSSGRHLHRLGHLWVPDMGWDQVRGEAQVLFGAG